MVIVQQDMYFVLKSYKEQLKVIKKYRSTLKQSNVVIDEAEAFLIANDPDYLKRCESERKLTNSICGGIQSDLEYAIQWIETGRQPGAMRGIDRRSVYELTYHMDPVKLERFARAESGISEQVEEVVLSDQEKYRIEDALSVLTADEKEVFLMHHVQLLSIGEIANLKKLAKSTIQKQLERGKKKITEQTSCSLFAFAG